ncbi:MAG: Crp/Fnr family transcriptional regulator [Bacteroidota bacterium]|nr:Crp/Fnr family transcriptional regulator [Bacteroidota bacterium]
MSSTPFTHLEIFSPFFEPELMAEVQANATLMNLTAGDVMLKIGKPVWGIPLLAKGTVKISRVNDEGQEVLLYYVKSGETCAMSFTCWMTTQISSVKSTAEDECVVYVIPGEVADQWMHKYPGWKKFVMNTILDGFTEIVRSIDDVAFKKMDDRLVGYLKEKSKISGSALVNLTHQQIADELGTNRVVVSRLLKKLETDGRLLLYRNQIKLLRQL